MPQPSSSLASSYNEAFGGCSSVHEFSGFDSGPRFATWTPSPDAPRSSSYPDRNGDNNHFIGSSFRLHPNGPALKTHLAHCLSQNWWRDNRNAPGNELDYFVSQEGSKYQCAFCLASFDRAKDVKRCVMRHMDYHPRG